MLLTLAIALTLYAPGPIALALTLQDCGVCSYCRDKPKFGGVGTKRQKCVKKRASGDGPTRVWAALRVFSEQHLQAIHSLLRRDLKVGKALNVGFWCLRVWLLRCSSTGSHVRACACRLLRRIRLSSRRPSSLMRCSEGRSSSCGDSVARGALDRCRPLSC